MPDRRGVAERRTCETEVRVELSLDGGYSARISTGVGFLDHMLELLARHGRLGLDISATGDRQVDDHHTVEDAGIVLGQAIDRALGDRAGIVRFGHAAVPMDEALAVVSLDLSGRGGLVFRVEFTQEKIGAFDVGLTREFLNAVAANARMTLHVSVPYGEDAHHIAEAMFKALGRALAQAVALDPLERGIPSTKGVL